MLASGKVCYKSKGQRAKKSKRAKLTSVKEPAAQPIAESDDSSRNFDNIDDFLGAK